MLDCIPRGLVNSLVRDQLGSIRLIFTTFLANGRNMIADECLVFCLLHNGCCYGNQFSSQNGKVGLPHLHSSHWHSIMDWNFELPMSALTAVITPLHLTEIW